MQRRFNHWKINYIEKEEVIDINKEICKYTHSLLYKERPDEQNALERIIITTW